MSWGTLRVLAAAVAVVMCAATATAEELTLEEVVARYVEARGGTERWREVSAIELKGTYATFSDQEPFTLVRARGDLYRLDFKMLGDDAVRARDGEGPWWLHPLLQPQAGRLTEDPYKSQIERESLFGPVLVDYAAKGIAVELAGATEIEGIPVIELVVTLESGQREQWFLDAESYLEVAVDTQVSDYTQSPKPIRQRAFFDDFREVEGLVIPFRLDYEFGHRLEAMTVERAVVDGDIDPSRFRPPAAGSD